MAQYFWRQPGWAVLIAIVAMGACTGGQTAPDYRVRTGGNLSRGKQIIVQYRCGACHTIPGINDAHGVFAPPLIQFSRRTVIAGMLPNTPQNLVHWIVSPQSIKPKTDMPVLGLSERQARDVTAFLYTLR